MSSKPLESSIEAAVTRLAKRLGILTFKLTSPSNRGVPDRIFFYQGKTLLLEIKRPGGKPTGLQLHTIGELKKQGMEAHVVYSVGEASDLLHNLIQPRPRPGCCSVPFSGGQNLFGGDSTELL